MKKILAIIYIIIVFIILYFLQSNFFTWFNIAGIKPNLFIIFLLLIGLFLGKKIGLACGILLGTILDLFISNTIGINAITLGVVGLLAGVLQKNFSREHRFTIILMSVALTFLADSINYCFILLTSQGVIQIITFLKILSIEILYNTLIIIIGYPLFQKMGEFFEQSLIENNKSIKYF